MIIGNNGTINGQGQYWWDKFKKKQFKVTRPYMIELLFSKNIQISNITLVDSPSWHVHPVYCENVMIKSITIIAPVTVPNTDGINPGTILCDNVNSNVQTSLANETYMSSTRNLKQYMIIDSQIVIKY